MTRHHYICILHTMQIVDGGSPESQVEQFSPLRDRVWLNTAHQGVLPLNGVRAAEQAIRWKTRPWEMANARFSSVPENLLGKLAGLLCVPARELVLGNSSSYGLHLLANGFPWRSGDEVLVVRGDFPSTYLPWVGLEKRGVKVHFIEPAGTAVEAEDVARHASSRTRVFCTTWVHSFLGHVIDLAAIGEICRDRGIRFVVNASQGVGARPLVPAALPVDAVASVGFKWLCGPYGTGFCWIRTELLKELELNRVYWLTYMTADDLERDEHIDISTDLGGRRYDVFGTANFFNFHAWAAALEIISELGLATIHQHVQMLVDRLLTGLEDTCFEICSPRTPGSRSSLVFISHPRRPLNRAVHSRLRDAGVDVALRRGRLRLSPHFYNTTADIDRALEVLRAAS